MSHEKGIETGLNRRQVLAAAGTGVVAAAGIAALPRTARADLDETIAAQTEAVGDTEPQQGKIDLKLPEIAENGNTVPVTVFVDSPMTEDDHVKAVHVFAEGNPAPTVASFSFTPLCGKASVSTRMRLAGTQHVRAVAAMSDGSVYMDRKEIKVTIGGCGG